MGLNSASAVEAVIEPSRARFAQSQCSDMYEELFKNAVLDGATNSAEVSRAVAVPAGYTAAQIDAVLAHLSGSGPPELHLDLQQTNDRGDWELVAGSSLTASRMGYSRGSPVLGLTGAAVRLRLTLSGVDAAAIASAGFNCARP